MDTTTDTINYSTYTDQTNRAQYKQPEWWQRGTANQNTKEVTRNSFKSFKTECIYTHSFDESVKRKRYKLSK